MLINNLIFEIDLPVQFCLNL